MIRRFRLDDAQPTRDVFVAAVRVGAAGRYTEAERLDWVPDPTMPEDWGTWLDGHITLVAETDGRLTGFMMVERDGYLNMAFVAPDQMGKGVADALYTALLAEVQGLDLARLTTLASRYSQGFFRRRGWVYPTDLSDFDGLHDYDPNQGPDQNPTNRPMSLTLKAAP